MPDVCLTPAPPLPPIPIPYPNIAQVPMVTGATTKVMVQNMGAVVEGSKIPMSQGDEAGVNGGVVSGVNMGPMEWKLFSSKVKFEGKGVAHLMSMTAHNGSSANAVGMQVVPSQASVIVAE